MTVYVDKLFTTPGTPQAGAGRTFGYGKQSCHMTADTPEELHRFASMLGLKRAWAQHEGRLTLHYDLTPRRREAALLNGAVETTARAELERIGLLKKVST